MKTDAEGLYKQLETLERDGVRLGKRYLWGLSTEESLKQLAWSAENPVPQFHLEYEAWYTRALSALARVFPTRTKEFQQCQK